MLKNFGVKEYNLKKIEIAWFLFLFCEKRKFCMVYFSSYYLMKFELQRLVF